MSEKQRFMRPQSSPEARGERLTILREMAGLRLIELSQKYNIGYTTIRQWAKGQTSLSTRGAKLIIEAMKQEGIECELTWLLHGSGNPPTYTDHETNTPLSNASLVEKEIALFKGIHPNAILLKIQDEFMFPFASIGDQVGGTSLGPDNFDLIDERYCIIESKTYGRICRLAQKVPNSDLFIFQPLTSAIKHNKPITLQKDKIIKAACVTRFWAKEP